MSHSNSLLSILGREFKGGANADCTVVADGREFRVWKLLLCFQSPIFQAMFSHVNTLESINSVVYLDPHRAETVGRMLRFLYDQKFPQGLSVGEARELYELAEYLDLSYLRENCLHRIYALLDHQNIYQCILDSYRFNIATLKQRVAHFVGQNLQRVTGRKEWNEVGERTQLEVLKEAIRRMDVGDLEQRVERSPTLLALPNQIQISGNEIRAHVRLQNQSDKAVCFKVLRPNEKHRFLPMETTYQHFKPSVYTGTIFARSKLDLCFDELTYEKLPHVCNIVYTELKDNDPSYKVETDSICKVLHVYFYQ